MPCLGLKIAFGAQCAGVLLSAEKALAGEATVVLAPAALAALAVQVAGMFATMVLLINCLDAADRHKDADSLRRELDALQREVHRLPH